VVETGLSGDVALIGCDDSTVARHADPPLPSVRQPTEETGRTMPRVLPAEVEQSTTVRRHVVRSTDLGAARIFLSTKPRAHARPRPAAVARDAGRHVADSR
jgi:hypothetical protein